MIEEDDPTIPKVGARRIPFGHSRFYGTSSFACFLRSGFRETGLAGFSHQSRDFFTS